MTHPNLVILEKVARALDGLETPVVFLGGATIALYLDAFSASRMRATLDVDCIVPADDLAQYHAIERRLGELGFRHHMEDDAPICRFSIDEVIVDVMPWTPEVLGFANEFAKRGFTDARTHEIASGVRIRILPLPYLVASKIEAYYGRGVDDPYASKDLEDILALFEGAPQLVDELAAVPSEVRGFVGKWSSAFLEDSRAEELVEGHLGRSPQHGLRVRHVLELLRAVTLPD